ncbi:hypothetical protein BN946_scf184940.g109 [Trametes cinnabarina]|uniref:Uncharacterized protein n=1 Tax=Pycnoporus cinnabarinus TaxID=5643 RepID=A0A060SBS2_PYCCI|nr:hypothetical protein BN946_scf184940.g109 [Trametes cinnabarina]
MYPPEPSHPPPLFHPPTLNSPSLVQSPLHPSSYFLIMALKRKFDAELDEATPVQNGKQRKLVPFPQSHIDSDVAMSDASMSDLEPLCIPIHPFHTRLPSNASYASSATSDSPRNSLFDLYPTEPDSYMAVSSHGFPDPSLNALEKSVGLIQPRGNNFTHHG